AMSWAYWAPKSTTRTVSKAARSGAGGSVQTGSAGSAIRRAPGTPGSVAHADALRSLQALAFGLQRRGDHDLGLLELLDRLIATRRHRRAEGAEQVEAAVVLVGRPDQDLLERAPDLGLDPGAPRQGRVEGGHAPVEAA